VRDVGESRKRSAALVREGRVSDAARVLFEAGLRLESAQLLAEHGQYDDAVLVLVGNHSPAAMDQLDAALLPELARFLEGAGRRGEAERIQRLVRHRAHDDAPPSGRVSSLPTGRASTVPAADPRGPNAAWLVHKAARAEQDGRLEDAAAYFAELDDHVAAARCLHEHGSSDRALRALFRVTKTAPGYRDACVFAIDLAVDLDVVDFDFDQFLGPFMRDGAKTREDIAALFRAAELYEKHGFVENAREAFSRIVSLDAKYKDATQRVARLARQARGAVKDFERVVHEDAAFRKKAGSSAVSGTTSETFPSLPELPPAPMTGRRSAQGRAAHEREFATPQVHERELAKLPTAAPPPTRAPAARRAPSEPPVLDVFDIPPGFIFADRYRILAKLGRGGMAVVHRATDLELGEDIAIKIFVNTNQDAGQIARFKQELTLARQLSHANIVRVYDIGTHGQVRFITMELLGGKDLADLLDESRDMLRDLGYLIQACEGLHCAHERGVVHRDLKPENIFITSEGRVKLMDFGIAKRQSGQANLTEAGFSAGTPAFMAPEQINDFRSVTHLSDLYSMGVIAYQVFTGELPFSHENPVALLMKHLNEQPAPPTSHNSAIPDELEFIIMQLLEKDPARRIQSCRDLASDLEALKNRLAGARKRR